MRTHRKSTLLLSAWLLFLGCGALASSIAQPLLLRESPDSAQGTLGPPYFGFSVAGAGDVNGDGFDDVIVGTDPSTSGGVWTQERANVYYGGTQGPSTQAGWVMYGFPPQPAGSVRDTLRIRKHSSGTNIILTWGGYQCGSGATPTR